MQELARKFLRCLIRGTESEELKDNIFKVVDAPIDFTVSDTGGVYQKIYKFVRDFHAERSDYPTVDVLQTAFDVDGNKDIEVLDELKEIKTLAFQTGSGFQYLISENVRELNRIALNRLLKEAHTINNEGLTEKKQTLKGSTDAVNNLINKSERFFLGLSQEVTQIEVGDSAPTAWDRYMVAKENQFANYGIMSGIEPIDRTIKGIKRKDLMLIAGSVGECKTTLALNYAYFAAVHMGYNVMFVSLEQFKDNIQDMFNAIHAANPLLWGTVLDKNKKPKFPDGLDYDHIKEGGLEEGEAKFYKLVLDDLATRGQISRSYGAKVPSEGYGRFEIWEPPTELNMTTLRSKLEFENKKSPIHLLVVDYPGLMIAEGNKSNETAMLNEIMKKMKTLARTFNNNQGLAVICPFQINREGKKNAVNKTEVKGDSAEVLQKPIYSTFHLSYANEAERSADYILYTYLNQDLRDGNQIHIGNIKNRHGAPFMPFVASTWLKARRIFYVPKEDYTRNQAPGEVVEVQL